ncbi:RNA-binding protein [Candidatus Bathyarchaeota archaeon]|nr:RNA-binding protein [Candidatus Bathyarchaeota archaeon]
MSLTSSGSQAAQKRRQHVAVAIPASLTEDTPHLREKTYKAGLIARACSIFRVGEIIVYHDKLNHSQDEDSEFIATILRYMDTPQYLRRSLFKLEPRLKFIGILPPLRTPHHQVTRIRSDLKPGMIRKGLVVETGSGRSLVDVGLKMLASVQEPLPRMRVVTVRLTGIGERIEAAVLDDSEIRIYWGYNVTVTKLPLAESTRRVGFDLIIATSRYGRDIDEVLPELQTAWTRSKRTLVAFGSPAQGLEQILAQEGLNQEQYADFTVNMIPQQGVETIRTEEAVYASLSILNTLR